MWRIIHYGGRKNGGRNGKQRKEWRIQEGMKNRGRYE